MTGCWWTPCLQFPILLHQPPVVFLCPQAILDDLITFCTNAGCRHRCSGLEGRSRHEDEPQTRPSKTHEKTTTTSLTATLTAWAGRGMISCVHFHKPFAHPLPGAWCRSSQPHDWKTSSHERHSAASIESTGRSADPRSASSLVANLSFEG